MVNFHSRKRSSFRRNFIRVGDERTSPASYTRTFECARLMIEFKCTADKYVNLVNVS